MDAEGYVPIQLIAGFKKVLGLTGGSCDGQLVASVLRG